MAANCKYLQRIVHSDPGQDSETPHAEKYSYICGDKPSELVIQQWESYYTATWSPQLGTNGLIRDQRYRTEHDAGMPMPD